MSTVDLRSDFLSRPTPAMMQAMMDASAAAPSFGLREDPWQVKLEEAGSAILGKEDALLFPTCTMANLAAQIVWTRPGDAILGDASSHVALSEAGGHAAVAGVVYRGLDGRFGRSGLSEWQAMSVASADEQRQKITLFVLENTHNRGGGNALRAEYLDGVSSIARSAGAHVHLDGSRLFNASVALGEPVDRLASGADSVAVSLNKGLCAPQGALLAGPRDFIAEAARVRQRLGGGLRPTAMISAAGLVALNEWQDVAGDHETASKLRNGCRSLSGLRVIDPPDPTNIVIVQLDPALGDAEAFCGHLATEGLLGLPFGADLVRFVTYRDIKVANIDRALSVLAKATLQSEGQFNQ